ncbi:hypothetical protein ACFJGV_08540 [Cnuibacter sp. UC19_7]|uniref:hypothetical protein n=1 Tax=Cnuibacter sp. UC19_7 TaxID=3350166 RepID=UPI00366E6D5C
MTRKRFVAVGVPGGYKIINSKTKRQWGNHYELMPDDLLRELNGEKRPELLDRLELEARLKRR